MNYIYKKIFLKKDIRCCALHVTRSGFTQHHLRNKNYNKVFLLRLKSGAGFTLVEVMTAIGIFSIASVIISSVYLNANNLHQHTVNFQRLQNDGRYIIEKLAREIRAREIKYPVENSPFYDHIEFLADELGREVSIALVDSNLEYIVDDQSANLNADDVEVTGLKFYIIPTAEDGWGTEPTTNKQPRVVISLQLQNKTGNPKYQKQIAIQTTISSKVYKR